MCVVSMVFDWGKQQWPMINPISPGVYHSKYPTENEYDRFIDLINKSEEYDRLHNQIDCPDETKKQWFRDLKEFMRKHYNMNT